MGLWLLAELGGRLHDVKKTKKLLKEEVLALPAVQEGSEGIQPPSQPMHYFYVCMHVYMSMPIFTNHETKVNRN